MQKKMYVLDTNVLLSDGNAITSFQENDIVIPFIVVEELDKHKSRQDEAGKTIFATAMGVILRSNVKQNSLFGDGW
jgi:predicted ribonuclease YlaK